MRVEGMSTFSHTHPLAKVNQRFNESDEES